MANLGWMGVDGCGCRCHVPLESTLSLAMVAGIQVLLAIGLGTQFTILSIAIQASVDAKDQGLAVGTLVFFRLFGALIGSSIGATAFSNIFARTFDSLDRVPEALVSLRDAAHAVEFTPSLIYLQLPPQILDLVSGAYAEAIRAVFYVLMATGILGFLSSLFIREISTYAEEFGRQHLQT